MWIHGTIAQVEHPDAIAMTVRKGRGTAFTAKPGPVNWFHFPIPTPAIDGIRPLLGKVCVFYVTSEEGLFPTPKIVSVHLWDGNQRIKTINNLSLKGDHGSKQDPQNTWAIDPPLKISHGLVISVNVEFPVPTDGLGNSDILFTTAGAEFQKP
jgi:hypothetical protein